MTLIIDPAGLTGAQQAGRCCVVPNCRRPLLPGSRHQVGRLPTGQPVYACGDCAPAIQPSAARERIAL